MYKSMLVTLRGYTSFNERIGELTGLSLTNLLTLALQWQWFTESPAGSES